MQKKCIGSNIVLKEKNAVLLLISYNFPTINFLRFFVSAIFDKPSKLRNKLKFLVLLVRLLLLTHSMPKVAII